MLESYLPDHNESISVALDKFKSIGIDTLSLSLSLRSMCSRSRVEESMVCSCRSRVEEAKKLKPSVWNANEFGSVRSMVLGAIFPARLVVYITVLGTIMLIIFLILKFLSECDIEADTDRLPVVAGEGTPLLNEITGNRDEETATFSSSEDVDYSKLCVICFEERKNCFFVPCGHSATCQGYAQKILSEESKVCPIYRRVIRKSRRLLMRL